MNLQPEAFIRRRPLGPHAATATGARLSQPQQPRLFGDAQPGADRPAEPIEWVAADEYRCGSNHRLPGMVPATGRKTTLLFDDSVVDAPFEAVEPEQREALQRRFWHSRNPDRLEVALVRRFHPAGEGPI